MTDNTEYMKLQEVADYLKVDAGWVYRAYHNGELKGYKIGKGSRGHVRFLRSEVDDYVKSKGEVWKKAKD